MSRWALRGVTNPSVLIVDTSAELTDATIETCPPSTPPDPFDRLLSIPAIRSIDLHRHRARLNLRPGSDPSEVAVRSRQVLAAEWGGESSGRDEAPRSFPVPYHGGRRVAESLRMAGDEPILRAVFGVPGVVEAILEAGQISVRLGPLFAWRDLEQAVPGALPASSS